MDPKAIYEEAMEAAKAAVRANAHRENPNAFDCGFAWVVLKPARGPFVTWLRGQKTAHIDAAKRHALAGSSAVRRAEHEANRRWGERREYGGGGWQFWMPGGSEHNGQSVAIFEAGARAMAEVFQRHGIDAQWSSRLD
jgi:hypothetical protein